MRRITTPFIGVALIAGAVWVAMQSYQKNFAGPSLSESEQEALGLQLLEFPRQLPPFKPATEGEWSAIRLQPALCDAMCQGHMTQLSTIGVHVISPSQSIYQDIEQVTSAEKYSAHQNKVLLLNSDGQFAGSMRPPYGKTRLDNALSALNL